MLRDIRPAAIALVTALAALAAGCPCRNAERTEKVELVVFAASSLTEVFAELERGFERANPGVDVRLSFAGSQVLRLQIEQGASADVFASANQSHVEALVRAGHLSRSRIFARNELVVIVPTSNPADIDRFAALDRASRIVIGTDNVPVGIYTRRLLDRARARLGGEFAATVQKSVVSEESNVRLVRAKVALGEADAAVVYRTDAARSAGVRVVPVPDEINVRASYPIGALAGSRHPAEAALFIDYVFSPPGREALDRHGFITEVR